MRGVRRFVRDLLRQRPTKPFNADREDVPQLRAAIALKAADADSGPSAEFVDSLRDRLRTELDGAARAELPRGNSRRRFVASVAAASAASIGIGAAIERGLSGDGSPGTAEPPPADRTVLPDNGEWRAVVAIKDLPDGGVRPFDAGTMIGFVHRTGDELHAVSGVCTHLGCKLALDGPARQLNCPCHNAAFAVDGSVLHHRLPIALAPLPKLMVRESEGVVQVFVPPRPA
jgi:nitrite reductase/ring-hydroxylating ferredoxin subunit